MALDKLKTGRKERQQIKTAVFFEYLEQSGSNLMKFRPNEGNF